MFRKSVWLASLIGGGAGLLIFELCDLALPDSPFLSRILGIAIFAVFLVILVTVTLRRVQKKKS
ncbi:MAG: hypothetical protein ACYTEZ_03295 [Planctomycetota bacterium]|jgi:hypothetical protein